MKITCPSCGEVQDDSGLTSFACAHCGKSLRTIRRADASAEVIRRMQPAPFGWPAKGWLSVGMVTHLVGLIVLIVSLLRRDAGGVWTPSLCGAITGATVAWMGFLALLVGLTAYAVQLVTRHLSEPRQG